MALSSAASMDQRRSPRTRSVLGLLSLLLPGCAEVLSVSAPAGAPSSFESRYAGGREHFAAGHYGLAVTDFQAAVAAVPDSIKALNGLAAAYDRVGRPDLAGRYYARALALAPEAPETLNNIGFSYLLQGKFDLAAVYLRAAHRYDGSNPAIAANRAIAEAALRAARARPGALRRTPATRETSPLPRAWIARTTPLVQTLEVRPVPRLTAAIAAVDVRPSHAAFRPDSRRDADTLPNLLAAPIGDTRLARDVDRLSGPLAAAMADVRVVAPRVSDAGVAGHAANR